MGQHSKRVPQQADGRPLQGRFAGCTTVRGYCAPLVIERRHYKPIPIITDFTDENGNDIMDEMVKENYINIKNDVKQIVSDELERIANDEDLCHLLSKK